MESYAKAKYEGFVARAAAEYVDAQTGEVIVLDGLGSSLENSGNQAVDNTVDEMGGLMGGLAGKAVVSGSENSVIGGDTTGDVTAWSADIEKFEVQGRALRKTANAGSKGIKKSQKIVEDAARRAEAAVHGGSNAVLKLSDADREAERAMLIARFG